MKSLKIGFAAIIFVVLTCLACDSTGAGEDAPDETSDPCAAPKGDRPTWCEDDVSVGSDAPVDTDVDPPECDVDCSLWLMTSQELADENCSTKKYVEQALCGSDGLCVLEQCELGAYDFDDCFTNGCEFQCPESAAGNPMILPDGFAGLPTIDDCYAPDQEFSWINGQWQRDVDGKLATLAIGFDENGITLIGLYDDGYCLLEKTNDAGIFQLTCTWEDGHHTNGTIIHPDTINATRCEPDGTCGDTMIWHKVF